MKILHIINKWRTRSRSIDGRCKFYDTCQYCVKDHPTCLHDDEAGSGNGGKPYCGKYNENEMKEKYR